MNLSVDIWLRGDNHATTVSLPALERAPAAWTEAMGARDGRATAYVCRDFACQAPVHTAEALVEEL